VKIIKTSASVDMRQRIAGRQQARSSTIKIQSLTESMSLLLSAAKEEMAEAKRAGREPRHNVTVYLADAYTKSGRSTARDGEVV
jgi:hypothetical protein